jgi:signal transduction histidine kinase
MEIKVKLFIIMVSLVIATLLVASIISINSFSTGMISEIRKHQEDNSVSTMNKISKTMFDRISDIKFLTDPNNIILSQPVPTEKKLEYLKSVLQIDRHTYYLATIFDINGKEIGDTSNSGVVGTNASQEAFFKIATKGHIYLDKAPVFSNKSSNTRIIRVAGPLYDSLGKATGVLLLVFPFSKISQMLQTESTLPYTEINLVSTNGSIMYSNYYDNSVFPKSLNHQPIFAKIQNSSNSIESLISTNLKGQGDALFVAAKDNGYLDYPGSGWFLITAQDTEQAFRPVLDLRNSFLLATILVLSVAVITVFFVARTISRPITKLKESADKISKGELDLSIKATTDDEIGELARHLDNMRESIQTTNRSLHTQTKELEKANKELTTKEQELAKAYDTLKESEKAKEEFISMVSHELKTPIVPIKVYSEMLLKTDSLGILNAKQRKAMQTVARSIEKLDVLVGDVLDVYKLDIGKLTLSKYDADVTELINRTISDLTSITVEKQIELKSDIRTAKDDSVFCDPKRIEQVLSNLVKNSVDFVPDKGGRIIIRVERVQNANSEFIFTVEDNGIGITAEERLRLFDKFYQVDTSVTRKHGGTGLGLAICRGIVEAHGGKIWVDDNYTNGASFKFTIPGSQVLNENSH